MIAYDVYKIYEGFVFSAETFEEAEEWIERQDAPWLYEIEENEFETDWDYEDNLEIGFNPYDGCYDFDC